MTLCKKFTTCEIILLQGAENYTYIHLITGEKKLSSYTLLRHEEKLKSFIRINRSYLVNPDFMKEYCLGAAIPHIVLKNVSRIKKPSRKVKGYEILPT